MMDNERSVPGCLFVLAMIALLSLGVYACGSTPQQNAHRAVVVAAEAVDVTDIAFSQAYTTRAHEALAAASSLIEYQAAMAPFDAGVRALRTARAALELGEAVVAIWDQGGAHSWPQAFGCIVGSLIGLRDVLVAAGVDVPAEILAAIEMVHGVVDTDACFDDAGVDAGADAGVDGGA